MSPTLLNQNSTGESALSGNVLRVSGARTHNLKNLTLEIPHEQLTVITGVSGSGKSSLAFDTLYAEGQRQYIESLSTYARQFLNQLERPDVDAIEGLQPTLCIDQRAAIANPRSTVATITEIYDYLRLMMARVAIPGCVECGEPIDQQSSEQICSKLTALPEGTKMVMMAPVVRGRKGAHRDVFSSIQKAGLVRVRVDGEQYDVESVPELSVRTNHTIEAIVDKIVVREGSLERIRDSLAIALRLADGLVSLSIKKPDDEHWQDIFFSTRYACIQCGSSIEEIEPRTFSFNSPYGACPACDGVGKQTKFVRELVFPELDRETRFEQHELFLTGTAKQKKQIRELLSDVLVELKCGSKESPAELTRKQFDQLLVGRKNSDGLLSRLEQWWQDLPEKRQQDYEGFRGLSKCDACNGARLRPEALAVKLAGYSIDQIVSMSVGDACRWFEALTFEVDKRPIGQPILTEMLHRLRFLVKVGVTYLTLDRAADTLSGGELQRVRLATSIGSGLVGVCYILDEPSIGLHQRDNDRLIESLRELQTQGNTVIVVEHDEAMMEASDFLIDIGPGAGQSGGTIVACGHPTQVKQVGESLTAAYLRGEKQVQRQFDRRGPTKKKIRLTGARLNNLKNVDVEVPLGMLIGVTGVSGSGKSSLFAGTLIPAIGREVGHRAARPGPFKKIAGLEYVDKLVEITQAPIGRSPRSTPATYCGVFDLIRKVWANTREAKTRGFTSSRFSFNAGSGRCSQCQGQGQEKIEMNFLPDLYVTCSVCGGQRYNRQTLQARFRDKTISDVLEMSVDEATEFFENFSKIHRLLHCLQSVGLGYVRLGQSSNTLSGGEAQRVKLAAELAKASTGQTVYFLDEPTTGLHFEDVDRLVKVLDGLVEQGNTVIVIEHNLDVIRNCDWLIDLGPDGGHAGGEILGCGSPEELAKVQTSITGRYL